MPPEDDLRAKGEGGRGGLHFTMSELPLGRRGAVPLEPSAKKEKSSEAGKGKAP